MHDDPFARAVERVETAEQQKRDAKRAQRAERLSGHARHALHIHATVFVAVNVLLIAMWAVTWQLSGGTDYPWFVWVLLGWGIGLAAHWTATRRLASSRPTPDSSRELERLAELHRAGSLDDEEFRSAKAKLLT
ncbi:MAG: 2TM domain-containing protein [Solirubrobacterales bacterium]|nr:2TM domain-containing protein [Solirubrobacterales bacterium]